jgi:hypothetical protein
MTAVDRVEFAGAAVELRHETEAAAAFADMLFADLRGNGEAEPAAVLDIVPHGHLHLLREAEKPLFCGGLGVQFAAALFDQVIFHLLNSQRNGVALHAGAVSWQGRTVVLPGQSGSGKSSVTAWLCACGASYLSDELIFLPDDGSGVVIPFPRPVCLKAGSAPLIIGLLAEAGRKEILADEQGAVIPHRLINPDFRLRLRLDPPALILFPKYQAYAPLTADKLPGARVSSLLMGCDVNARNLPDHGFRQLTRLARAVPAWQISYSSFAGFEEALAVL